MKTFADNVIDALGGSTAVSRKTGAPLSTVHSWRRNGLPPSRLEHLKLIAAQDGVAIDWTTGLPLETGDSCPADHDGTDTTDVVAVSGGNEAGNSRQVVANA
jgi:hypothetical protein